MYIKKEEINIQQQINTLISRIETKCTIKILYVCEAGSRAWGLSSEMSDFDVRFIYIHPYDWYLSIDQNRDVIDNNSIGVFEREEKRIDVSGWELSKALRLFRKSNPSLLEWLHSNIVYYNRYSTIERMKSLESEVFSAKSCLHHYVSMANRNANKYLNGERTPSVKEYLNIFRPLFISMWISEERSFPTLEFQSLLNGIGVPFDIHHDILFIMKEKKVGNKTIQNVCHNRLRLFIENQLTQLKELLPTIIDTGKNPTVQLNQLFRDSLKEVFNS